VIENRNNTISYFDCFTEFFTLKCTLSNPEDKILVYDVFATVKNLKFWKTL